MSGTNPGSWPDQEPNEPNMARKDSFILPKGHEYWNAREDVYISKARPFTAADLQAAMLDTVERCMIAGLEYVDNPQNADLMYHGGLDGFISVFKKLKEEINEG